MSIKKHLFFSSDKQIWRLLITDTEKLIIENRDMQSKQVYFNCFDLQSTKIVFKDFQLEEKHWIGIDAVYKDVIFFHKFPKPDLPGHKEIIAFDIHNQKVIWTNDELTFSFAFNDKVYAFTQGFEERHFRALDFKSGELLEDLKSDHLLVNSLRSEADKQIDWSVYSYPEKLSTADEETSEAIKKIIGDDKTEGEIEFNNHKDFLLFNFHVTDKENSFTNNFYLIDQKSGKVLLNETLNKNAPSLFNDSFFIYKNFLFLLKEKNEVLIFTME